MKKNFMSAIIIATMIAMAPAAFAGISKEKKGKAESAAVSTSTIEVKYAGEADGYVLLQVNLAKTGTRLALLRITDGFGELLHTERISENAFTRYIKVSPDELKSIELSYDTFDGISKKRFNLSVSRQEEFRITEVAVN